MTLPIRPTRRALGWFAASGVLALLPALGGGALWPPWAAAVGALLGLLVVDALRLPRRRGFACALDAPEELHPGVPVAAIARLALPGARALAAELALDADGALEPVGAAPAAFGDAAATVPVALRAARRGTARVTEAWLRYEGPLGLAATTARAEVAFERPVVPDLRPLEREALRFFRERDLRAGLKIERYRGDGTEFDSLRSFATGDDPRAVHWKASARHRALLTRQYRAERNHQVVLALDTGRLMGERLGDLSRLDHALSAALLLGFVALSSGDRVGVFTFGARPGPALAPAAGVASFPRLRRFSSTVLDRPEETNFTLGLTTLAATLRRRSLLIVLTDFVDTVSAGLMVENLTRLAARHVVVFVALRDPGLDAVAGARPDDALALHRAVVAEGLVREREAVLRRLERFGIAPLDATPAEVGPELVNRYLDIRRRERV